MSPLTPEADPSRADEARQVDASSTGLLVLLFSRDRPFQLDGTLRSLARNVPAGSLDRIDVIYRATSPLYAALYRQLRREHPEVRVVEEHDFRTDVLTSLSHAADVLFLVDDAVVVRAFDPRAAVASLRGRPDAIGFSLRLGRNTTYCYPADRSQSLPTFRAAADGVLAFDWPGQADDFGYPLEVSSSIFRGDIIKPLLGSLGFKDPNSLEAGMANAAGRLASELPTLLCLETSVAFCIPSNVVQTSQRPNRAGGRPQESPLALARDFDRGARLDVDAYQGFVPQSCHQEVELRTTWRSDLPTVSIVTPCHGHARYLPDMVESVLNQTLRDWELIIIDDGSPDDTADVVQGLIASHPEDRIRLLRQPNLGVSEARNTGVRAAWGRYILPLDADDRLDPSMLERVVAMLESRPDVAIAYTDVQEFGDRSRALRAAEFDFDRLLSVNQISHCALYRREVWEATGGYDQALEPGYEDWDFWIAAGERGYRAMRVPGLLFHYRVKEVSRQSVAQAHDAQLRQLIRRRHPASFSVRQRARRRLRFALAGLRYRGS